MCRRWPRCICLKSCQQKTWKRRRDSCQWPLNRCACMHMQCANCVLLHTMLYFKTKHQIFVGFSVVSHSISTYRFALASLPSIKLSLFLSVCLPSYALHTDTLILSFVYHSVRRRQTRALASSTWTPSPRDAGLQDIFRVAMQMYSCILPLLHTRAHYTLILFLPCIVRSSVHRIVS